MSPGRCLCVLTACQTAPMATCQEIQQHMGSQAVGLASDSPPFLPIAYLTQTG